MMQQLIQYMGNHPWLVTAAAAMIAVVIAYEMRMRSGNQLSISPQEAVQLMNQNALVLDLRAQDLYGAGHLSGARQLAADQILSAGDSFKRYKEKPVLVYCNDGSVGAAAARQLAAQGFTKAVHLRGGVAAWRADNLPLVRG